MSPRKFAKTEPLDLVALCHELGLRIREVPARGFDGALIRSKACQKGIVAVKASIREASRKRFTIAHEIGHFIIPHHRNLGNICEERKIESFDRSLNRSEMEANEFAAELLLPSGALRRRFDLSEFSLAQISAVAAEYGTSLTATTRSFLTLTDLPCAMIWSVANRARWFVRSDAFRFSSRLPNFRRRAPSPPRFSEAKPRPQNLRRAPGCLARPSGCRKRRYPTRTLHQPSQLQCCAHTALGLQGGDGAHAAGRRSPARRSRPRGFRVEPASLAEITRVGGCAWSQSG